MNEIQKKNKELCEKMPYLIPRNVWTDEIREDYDYSYIRGHHEVPTGWMQLFVQMCEDIRQPLIDANYLEKFRFSQIKEKYNSLRCYNFGATDLVHDIIRNYEYVSKFVCQKCGRPARYCTQYWWIAGYCEDCIEGMNIDKNNCKLVTFNPIMRISGYKDGEKYSEEVDVSDIWNRLYEQT